MKTYTIFLDPAFDLAEGGHDASDEECDLFADAYIAEAARVAAEQGIEITVELDNYVGLQSEGHVYSEEETELWQEIHDRVLWPPIDP